MKPNQQATTRERREAPATARERGQIAILAALSILATIGAAGIAVDAGRLYIVKSELQNAADACALAAASQLDGSANALINAENAGLAVVARNRVNFQSTSVPAVGSSVGSTASTITFSANLNANFLSKDGGATAATAKYATCTVGRDLLNTYFMQAVGFNDSTLTVFARAAASLEPSQTNCAIPLGVCGNPSMSAGTPKWGLTPGQWTTGLAAAGSGTTGNYGWIDFPNDGGSGASTIAAQILGTGACYIPASGAGTTPQAGVIASPTSEWNSRFGLYKTGGGQPNETNAPPDRTGYAYAYTAKGGSWPAQFNAYPDYQAKRAANTRYQGDIAAFGDCNQIWENAGSGKGKGGGGCTGTQFPTNSTNLATTGADRRLMVSPIINCAGGSPFVMDWACVLLLHPINPPQQEIKLEYVGLASAIGSPCATKGLAGGSIGPKVPTLVQ